MRGRQARQQGLTLVELMVVLVVMGVLVGAALPAMGNAIADRRVASAARDVVALFKRARYMSVAYGRAHQVQYTNAIGGALPQPWAFETIRGTGGACFLSSFESGGNTLANLNCGANAHWRCVDRLYANDYDPTPADNDFVVVDAAPQVFCYEGGVNNYLMNGGGLAAGWLAAPSQAARGFVIFRQRNGNPVGVARKVVVPFGSGSPRVLQ